MEFIENFDDYYWAEKEKQHQLIMIIGLWFVADFMVLANIMLFSEGSI